MQKRLKLLANDNKLDALTINATDRMIRKQTFDL